MSKVPAYEVLGEITLKVYRLPNEVNAPWIDWGEPGEHDTTSIAGVYCHKDGAVSVVVPEKVTVDNNRDITFDKDYILTQIDGSASSTSTEVKTTLEETIERIVKDASVDDLIKLREAKLI